MTAAAPDTRASARPGDWPLIVATSAGTVFGFPLFTSIAMRHVEAVHASVMLGVLPLATALVGAWVQLFIGKNMPVQPLKTMNTSTQESTR